MHRLKLKICKLRALVGLNISTPIIPDIRSIYTSLFMIIMTSHTKKVPVSSFGHVSSAHGHDACAHQIFAQLALYPIRSYWHFPKFKTAASSPPSWIFKSCKFGTFRHVNSVVLELYIKFGSNICDSHWDQHTYAPDIHLMTSRELTSGFDFWSAGHLRMAVMHLPITYGAYICMQSKVIDISLKFKMAAVAILDF